MPIVESRQRYGLLTIDAVEYGCQASNVRVVPPDQPDEATEEVLCGDAMSPEETEGNWVLAITAVQDFTEAAGFVKMTWTKHGQTVPFSWKPNGTQAAPGSTGPTISGDVRVWSAEVGGEMNRRLNSELEWQITSGQPEWTDAAAAAPDLTAVSPTSGTAAGGTAVTLTGTGFTSDATVAFDGVAATAVTFTSATELQATTPAGTAGPADVAVTTPGGTDTLVGGFSYT